MDLMEKQTFQERQEAVEKLQRAKLSSCQLPTYYVGWNAWSRLRDDYRKSQGAAFRLSLAAGRGSAFGLAAHPRLLGNRNPSKPSIIFGSAGQGCRKSKS
jgi:hypothetical protein